MSRQNARGVWLIGLCACIGGLLAMPAASSAATLYDQLNNPSAAAFPNNASESNHYGDNNDNQTADDFTVPQGQAWNVNAVEGDGDTSGITSTFNVFIYMDAGGKPGGQLFSGVSTPSSVGLDYTFPISGAPSLQPGHYWVSLQMNLAIWHWKNRTVQSGNPAVWQNPGGGEGIPACLSWTVRTTCFPSSNGPDQTFRLLGDVVPPTGSATTTTTKCKKKKKKKSGAEIAKKKKCKKKKKK